MSAAKRLASAAKIFEVERRCMEPSMTELRGQSPKILIQRAGRTTLQRSVTSAAAGSQSRQAAVGDSQFRRAGAPSQNGGDPTVWMLSARRLVTLTGIGEGVGKTTLAAPHRWSRAARAQLTDGEGGAGGNGVRI